MKIEQGVLAKNKDLLKAFGTDNQLEVCRIILDKGEMQVRRHARGSGRDNLSVESCHLFISSSDEKTPSSFDCVPVRDSGKRLADVVLFFATYEQLLSFDYGVVKNFPVGAGHRQTSLG